MTDLHILEYAKLKIPIHRVDQNLIQVLPKLLCIVGAESGGTSEKYARFISSTVAALSSALLVFL